MQEDRVDFKAELHPLSQTLRRWSSLSMRASLMVLLEWMCAEM